MLCECGCGAKAPIATVTRPRDGHVKGQPMRFVLGHRGRMERIPLDESYVERDCGHTTPCWVWTRAKFASGYGVVLWQGRMVRAHIALYERENGPVPHGLELDHLCRVPACVNPAHLEPVTHVENMRRGRVAKLDVEKVRDIRARAAKDERRRVLATEYGVSMACIKAVVERRNWKDV